MANTKKKSASPATKKATPAVKENVTTSKKTKPTKSVKSASIVNKKIVVAEETPVNRKSTTSSTQSSMPAMKIKKSYVISALAIVAVGLILYAFRSFFVVATVNGQPVTRLGVIKELETQHGKQAVESLVVKTLVEQEAQKKNVSVSTDEVNKEIKKNEEILKQNGQTLDQFLASRGLTKAYYLEGLRLQLLAKKIVGQVKITDKQVTDYIEQNKERFAQYPKPEDQKTAAKSELESQEVGTKINDWLEKLRTTAKINYIYNY